jgi:protoheme IX farnesyltransferase
MLIVFTAIVGMFVSVPGWPGLIPLLFGTLGIGLAASSAAVYNHVLDARIDIQMMRTMGRPLPQGKLTEKSALTFATVLCIISMLILWFLVNPLTAILTFISLIGYAVVYTAWLKRATPQNIVIGGAAGAAPPILGWTAVTNEVEAGALLMFLIVFVWTPPHFWALAIARKEEHGEAYTRLNILLYTILLVLVTILPYLIGMSGVIYLATAIVLDAFFLYYAIQMYRVPDDMELPMKTFKFSISYLGFLFAALLVDHYLLFHINL